VHEDLCATETLVPDFEDAFDRNPNTNLLYWDQGLTPHDQDDTWVLHPTSVINNQAFGWLGIRANHVETDIIPGAMAAFRYAFAAPGGWGNEYLGTDIIVSAKVSFPAFNPTGEIHGVSLLGRSSQYQLAPTGSTLICQTANQSKPIPDCVVRTDTFSPEGIVVPSYKWNTADLNNDGRVSLTLKFKVQGTVATACVIDESGQALSLPWDAPWIKTSAGTVGFEISDKVQLDDFQAWGIELPKLETPTPTPSTTPTSRPGQTPPSMQTNTPTTTPTRASDMCNPGAAGLIFEDDFNRNIGGNLLYFDSDKSPQDSSGHWVADPKKDNQSDIGIRLDRAEVVAEKQEDVARSAFAALNGHEMNLRNGILAVDFAIPVSPSQFEGKGLELFARKATDPAKGAGNHYTVALKCDGYGMAVCNIYLVEKDSSNAQGYDILPLSSSLSLPPIDVDGDQMWTGTLKLKLSGTDLYGCISDEAGRALSIKNYRLAEQKIASFGFSAHNQMTLDNFQAWDLDSVAPTPTEVSTAIPSVVPTVIATQTIQPTETATSIPTPTSSPTITSPPNMLFLYSECSNDPSTQLNWRIFSSYPEPATIEWDIYGTTQRGVEIVQSGDNYFVTETVPYSPNTLRIFKDGVQVDARAASFEKCVVDTPTPTPTPTATFTQPIWTPIPTTPVTMYRVSGSIKGRNGRRLSSVYLRRLNSINSEPGNIYVRAKNARGQSQTIYLTDPYHFTFYLTPGKWEFRLYQKDNLFVVTSRPRYYHLTIKEDVLNAINFAIKFKSTSLSSAAAKGRATS